MKTVFVAAAAALLALGGAARANGVRPDAHIVGTTVAGPQAQTAALGQAARGFRMAKRTGLPSYEMRADGTMINGLLPANSWQGRSSPGDVARKAREQEWPYRCSVFHAQQPMLIANSPDLDMFRRVARGNGVNARLAPLTALD